MAQGGDEQAATRALAEAAQERQGRMFDTHHQFVKQNEELMRRIAAEQNLAFKLVERLGPCPAPEPRPVQLAQGAPGALGGAREEHDSCNCRVALNATRSAARSERYLECVSKA